MKKSSVTYLCCIALGLLNFVLFVIPYLSVFVEMFGDTVSEGVNGYDVMDLWEGGFSGVMSSLFQILVLVVGVIMLAYGVCGMLKDLGVFKKFPDKIGKCSAEGLGFIALLVHAILNVLLLVFLIIFCATNTESAEGVGSAGIRLSAGIFVALALSVVAVFMPKLLGKKK